MTAATAETTVARPLRASVAARRRRPHPRQSAGAESADTALERIDDKRVPLRFNRVKLPVPPRCSRRYPVKPIVCGATLFTEIVVARSPQRLQTAMSRRTLPGRSLLYENQPR